MAGGQAPLAESRSSPLTLAIVGCGRIADTYGEVLASTERFVTTAVVDSVPARAAALANRLGAQALGDCEALLAAAPPHAALVLTPPATHAAISGGLLRAGCHVMCEKPLAVGSAEAEALLDTARHSDRLLMMASKFRYVPDVVRAREILHEGALGEVLLFENVFCSRVAMAGRWNADPRLAGGGVLIDNGSHSVDLARYLIGPIARVQAQFGKPVQALQVEDTVRMLLQFEAGAMGSVDLSWSLHKELDSYVQIYGAKGTLELGWRRSRWKRGDAANWHDFGLGYDKREAFKHQLENFAAAIDGGDVPRISAEDALQSVLVIEAAYKSAAADKWIEVAP
jgi:predicted dehydrogenase